MKTRYVMAGVMAWLAYALTGAAQSSKPVFTSPVLGYVYDGSAGGVRAVMGVPGAAGLEGAFDWPGGLVELAPRRSFGLLIQNGLHLIEWTLGAPALRRLSEPAEGPGHIAFAPVGKVAAVYWELPGRLEVWVGLPENPERKWSAVIDEPQPDGASLAVSDDGARVAWIDGGKLWIVSAASGPRAVSGVRGATAAAFRPASHQLILTFENGAEALLLEASGGLADRLEPADYASFSADGRSVILASRESGRVVWIDLQSRARQETSCSCRPDGLFPLRGNAVFRLSSAIKGGFPVFDGDSGEPRIVLVATTEVEP